MRRYIFGFVVGFGAGWITAKTNPLWFKQFAPTPTSIPEWMAAEARAKGMM